MASKAKTEAEAERLAELAAVKNLKRVFPDRFFARCTDCGSWCMTTDRKERSHPLCRQSREDAARAGSTGHPADQGELAL